jgi:putative peptide zinc metalloprotease protein
VGSRTTQRVLRATDGRPVLRTVAAAAGALLVLFASWAWWPRGQYVPIRGDERGTVQDGLALRLSKPSPPAIPVAIPGIPAAAEEPQPAMILTPRNAGTAPAMIVTVPAPGGEPVVRTIEPSDEGGWPFPFPPPPPPAEGDNRAQAVTTQDGAVTYDLAFSLVWVVDADVEHRNEAWALASCKRCRTVAVAFQTILVVGRAEVVKPVNAAVSINFQCDICDTSAIAVQLVATLNGMPPAEVVARIEAIWDRVEALAETAEGLDAGQLYTQVTGFEAEILEVLLTSGPVDATSTASADGVELGDGSTSTTEPTTTSSEPTTTTDPTPAPDAPSEPSTTTSEPAEPTTTTTTQPAETTTTTTAADVPTTTG